MEKNDRNGKPSGGAKGGFRREDSNRTDNSTQFFKDKRKANAGAKSSSYGESRGTGKPAERRSFNPNFTKDNKLKGNEPRGERTDRGDRGESKFESRSGKPGFERREFGGEKKPYPKRESGYGASSDKPKFGGEKKPYIKPEKARPRMSTEKFVAPMRLNRHLAISGLCSRREADDLIVAGLVSVNGVVVTELGTKVTSADEVKFNESIVRGEKKVYILMNKPKGFVTTLDDPHADKTVMDLIKNACSERVYPVGRLDKNSVGVLLITNDGDLTRQLTHPGYMKRKVYQASLDKALTRADMESIASGIELEDGPIHADEISYVSENKKEIGIEIHSGRNRIIRRIFDSLGYKVDKLDRVYFAGLTKKNLKRGEWRYLADSEVAMLRSGMYE